MNFWSIIKKLLPTSLLGRSLLILIIPVIIVQIVTTFVFFDRHWSRVVQGLSSAVVGEIEYIIAELEEDDGLNRFEDIKEEAILYFEFDITFKPEKSLQLASNTDQHIQARFGWERVVANIFEPELSKSLDRPFHLHLNFDEKWVLIDVQLEDGVLQISFPQRRLFSSSAYIYLLWVFASAMVLLLVAIAFMRNQVRPIRRLAHAAERFGRGRDVDFFKPEGAREVRRAGQAFINMYKRIRRQIEQRTLMLAGVSHDLRTPLTRLKLELSMMPKDYDTSEMLKDLQDMENMVSGYLDFVRGDGEEDAQVIHLPQSLYEVVSESEANDKDVLVQTEEELVFEAKPLAFKRCLHNILSNAKRYADVMHISYSKGEGDFVHIEIEDNGPGLAPEEFDEVFKPFYRVDKARSNSDAHVGLGLPIVMDIMHSHGGEINLDKSELGGLKVVLTFPF